MINELLLENVKTLAEIEKKTVLQTISLLQAGAARLDDGEATLDQLCELKRKILGL